ncbi:RuBisCO large subunit-binding protein subunit beta, chloroplastic [Capsicum baccatum]|uniref:RuBisCO large subunit-binding protein subunit beta, chloroplastic n=1 Tax=Capsicum baccatum TaxID=33114 RepID=A0A2G2WXM8_CAPBA|nr:RuBisCO large subunit-binding protein subunit beta, chloroplastic [Capsicum baccatum]
MHSVPVTDIRYSAIQLPLIDKKITNDRDLANVLEDAIINGYPILIIAEDNEQDVASTLVVNNLRGALQATAVKSPDFGNHILDAKFLKRVKKGALLLDMYNISNSCFEPALIVFFQMIEFCANT